MNQTLWNAAAARVLAMTFVLAGATACGERLSDTRAKAPTANEPSPSAVVIGQAPADPASTPGADTPQVTPPAGAQGEVSKGAESTARPLEGDNHSHSTTAPVTPQKAEGASATDMERKAQ